jgi:hypothetical protein
MDPMGTDSSRKPAEWAMNANEMTESSAIGQEDRRAQARQAINAFAAIYLIHDGSILRGRILDLSLGGCRVDTEECFPVDLNERVEVGFYVSGMPFRIGGVIQGIHDRHHVGIRFLEMSERSRGRVAELMEEIGEMAISAEAAAASKEAAASWG